jgi:RecB family endonuclease NucS
LTDYGKYIDLLAIDGTGSVIVIEIKKNKTPREVTVNASYGFSLHTNYLIFVKKYGLQSVVV